MYKENNRIEAIDLRLHKRGLETQSIIAHLVYTSTFLTQMYYVTLQDEKLWRRLLSSKK